MNKPSHFLKNVSVFSLVICFALVGCQEPPPVASDDLETIPAQMVRAAAVELYDMLEAGEDPAMVVRDIADAFGLYHGPTMSLGSIQTSISQATPVFLEDHVILMSRGYRNGFMVTVDSFVDTMVDFGAYAKQPYGPLTRQYLSNGLSDLLTMDEYTIRQVVAALILHLGQERASRAGGITDPVWGDGLLDPIQFTLLTYAVFLSGDDPVGAAKMGSDHLVGHLSLGAPKTSGWRGYMNRAAQRARGLPRGIRDVITGQIGEILGIPLTGPQAVEAIICVSTTLYSYDLNLTADHTSINRRWPENPAGSNPYQSDLTASLTFDFTPHNEVSRFVVEGACGVAIPPNGPVAGKPVAWSLEGELPGHGSLEIHDHETRADGTARANYATFDERVPRVLRRGLRDNADGTVDARVSQLLPSKWRTLEVIVRSVRGVGWDGAHIAVNFYELPDLQVVFDTTVQLNDADQQLVITARFYAAFPLERIDEMGMYFGSGTLNYQSANVVYNDPDCTATIGQLTDGSLHIFITIDENTHDMVVVAGVAPVPSEVITLICPEREPVVTPPVNNAWGGWALAHMDDIDMGAGGVRIRGPWMQGAEGSQLIAITEYTAQKSQGDGNATATTKVELRRR